MPFRKSYGHPDIHMDRQPMAHPLNVASGPTDWNEALDIISFGSPEQVDGWIISIDICILYIDNYPHI